ncbi:MAG: hypothetical protein CMF71_08415 [Magnetovibrio sp.]|nr:hypothetical protein [Magnetovibrio sp.]
MATFEEKKDEQNRYKVANERLEAALLRLEKVVTKQPEPKNSEDPDQIATLITENKKLREINNIIDVRLSRAIRNLKNILKEA